MVDPLVEAAVSPCLLSCPLALDSGVTISNELSAGPIFPLVDVAMKFQKDIIKPDFSVLTITLAAIRSIFKAAIQLQS